MNELAKLSAPCSSVAISSGKQSSEWEVGKIGSSFGWQEGDTATPYTITHSARARRQRIVVTAGEVEVSAPEGVSEDQVAAFVHERRRWVFDSRARMLERDLTSGHPQRHVSGAKIPYRGRQVRLRVEDGPGAEIEVSYRNGFHVTVPEDLAAKDRDAHIAAALQDWPKARLRQDVAVILDRFCKRLGLEAQGFRLRDQKHLWGSCGKDGVIYLNWHLI